MTPLTEPAAGSVSAGQSDSEAPPVGSEMVAAELEALIEKNPDRTDTRNAFASLFQLWDVEFDMSSDRACEQAQDQQLFCLFQRGSLAQIQNLTGQ